LLVRALDSLSDRILYKKYYVGLPCWSAPFSLPVSFCTYPPLRVLA